MKKMLLVLASALMAAAAASAQTVIKFADNNPDQTQGMGKLNALLADSYMKENPGIKIQFELNDNEAHRTKIKIYAASNQLPDIYMNWCDPASLDPMIKGGYAADLGLADFKKSNFLPGALEESVRDGKLYGVPRNFDIWALFYNKALFDKYKLKVPKTISELKAVSKVFQANGIVPVALNGKDRWNQVVLLNDLLIRTSGGQTLMAEVMDGKSTFGKQKAALDAAKLLKEFGDTGVFQKGYIGDDYGVAQNLFVQGKAAMYYMGTWEMGMATNTSFPEDFRKNVRFAFFPTLDGAKDTGQDVLGRTGGIYSVNPKSTVKDEAIKFLRYMFKPENWAKIAWQQGIATPAQKWDAYLMGTETPLAKDISGIFASAKSISGQPFAWRLTSAFQEDVLNFGSELLVGKNTPAQFWDKVDASSAKNSIN